MATGHNYPTCAEEYQDSSRFLGEYHSMEMKLKNTMQQLSRCRAKLQYTKDRFEEERHDLRVEVLNGESRIQELKKRVGELEAVLLWGSQNGNGNGNSATEMSGNEGSGQDSNMDDSE